MAAEGPLLQPDEEERHVAVNAPGHDPRMEHAIGWVLRGGVVLAFIVALAGGLLYLAREGHAVPSYATFVGEPEALRTLGGIVSGALALHPRAIVQLGLLLLIATPVVRVAFSLVAFAFERDRTYVVVTFIVLVLLLLGLTGHAPGEGSAREGARVEGRGN